MRIISGKHKGRRFSPPKKLPVRPTTDIAKEGLFNILWNRYDFTQLKVLDLFSGTGNISFEFASRGSSDITAVDQHYGCLKFIKRTAESLGENIRPLKNDVFRFLQHSPQSYDLIFADPPYDFSKKAFREIIDSVFAN